MDITQLATIEDEKAVVKQFDDIFELLSQEAQVEVRSHLARWQFHIKDFGEVSAKMLYMRLHRYLNMTPAQQREHRDVGLMMKNVYDKRFSEVPKKGYDK